MKKTLTTVLYCINLFTLQLFAQNTSTTFPDYYYYEGQPVHLGIVTDQFSIKFNDNLNDNEKRLLLNSFGVNIDTIQTLPAPVLSLVTLKTATNETDLKRLFQQLSIDNRIEYCRPFYQYGTIRQTLTNRFIVKLNQLSDYSLLQQMAQSEGAIITKATPYTNDIYILEAVGNKEPIALANIFHESGLFAFAEPDFIFFMEKMTSDPLYADQWSIENLGNSTYPGATPNADMDVDSAWNITTGDAAIKIAVLDEGVDLQHPDLVNNLLPGFDATGLGSAGAPFGDDAHGTACAGIIAAEANNGIGMAGIAYDSKIIPVRIAYSISNGSWVTTSLWISNAINWSWQTAGADILNNSWGGGSPSSLISNAFTSAVTNGRNGLGTVVIVSAGNDNTSVAFPALLNNVIAVGAMSMCNERKSPTSCDGEFWWGTNYGTNLDVIAPGVKIVATDISGVFGYELTDYTMDFNGTSSAAPNTSGIMALILATNPSLTETQARAILESTCKKVGGYTYTTNAAQPNGTWNNEMGYGSVDAYSAVQQAFAILPDYCLPVYSTVCTNGAYIENVSFHTITNNGTGCAFPDTSNYSDYASMTTDVNRGEIYTLSVTTSSTNGQYCVALLDFNNDIDFEDAGEFFDLGYINAGATGQISIAIPYDANLGTTRLRILTQDGVSSITQADICSSTLTSGEVENYEVDILLPIPTIAVTPDSLDVVLEVGNVMMRNIYVTNVSPNTIPYQIDFIPNNGVSISSNAGVLLPTETDTIIVTYDATNQLTNIYFDTIKFRTTSIDSIIKNVESTFSVIDEPIAGFVADATFSCDGSIQFIDTSMNIPNSWYWDFGDGNTDSTRYPTHVYQTAGFYDVSLTVCNILGCDTATYLSYIHFDNNGSYCDTLLLPADGSTITTNACTGIIYDNGGRDNNYSNNASGNIVIEVPSAQNLILTFHSFKVENCCDYVRVYDGNSINAPLIGTFAGYSVIPGPFMSSGNALTIRLVSGGSATFDGFEASWQCFSSNCPTPTNLQTTTNVSDVAFNWDSVSLANTYQLRWKKSNEIDLDWRYDACGTNTFELNGLVGATDYVWQVRSNCTSTLSDWSVIDTFTTATAFSVSPDSLYALLVIGDSTTQNVAISNLINNNIQQTAVVVNETTAYLSEDFENASYSIFTDNGGMTYEMDDYLSQGNFSLKIIGGNQSHSSGLSYNFGEENPDSISFYVKVSNSFQSGGYFIVGNQNNFGSGAIHFSCTSSGMGIVANNQAFKVPFYQNGWYFIALKNIDYTTQTFDYYVNGTLAFANVPFRENAETLSEVRMYNYYTNMNCWFDDIYIGRNVHTNQWLATPNNTNTLTQGATDLISVQFNAIGLTPDIYTGNLAISSAQTDSITVLVPVKIEVIGLPESEFDVDKTYSCDGIIQFEEKSEHASSWHWDFGDGYVDTTRNPTHIYQSSGLYTVTLSVCNYHSCDTLTKNQLIEIDYTGIFCDTLFMPTDASIITTTRCTGILYDDGGPNGNYSNNANGIVVIEPTNAQSIKLTLPDHNVSTWGGDVLTIYDGNSTNAPILANFVGSAFASPPIITSGGAVTIKFTSNSGITRPGFAIAWECTSNACNVPMIMSDSIIDVSQANLSWDAISGVDGYVVRWRDIQTTDWQTIGTGTPTNSVVLANLNGNTTYQWQVITVCSGGNLSDWSGFELFTTANHFSVNPDTIHVSLVAGDSTTQQVVIQNLMPNPLQYNVNAGYETLYAEDFESGTYNSFTNTSVNMTYEIDTTDAAVGFKCLKISGGDYNFSEGLKYDFGTTPPNYLSFRVKSTSTTVADAYVRFTNAAGTATAIGFSCNGIARMGTQYTAITYNANQWYQIEFKNINYVLNRFDYYVDGQLKQANASFSNGSVSVEAIYIVNYVPSTVYFDDFRVGTPQTLSFPNWMEVTPTGSLNLSLTDTVDVILRSAGLAVGVYESELNIVSNSPDSTTIKIPCIMEVGQSPIAGFYANQAYSCDGTVQFVNTSQYQVPTRYWDFGDGTTSSEYSPSHTYSNSGVYTVTFIGCNQFGCDTLTRNQYITVSINASFCDTVYMPTASIITVTECTGTLYDDGGANNNYANSVNGTLIIEPANAQQITLNILSFGMANTWDFLRIYDGNSISAPLIGSYNGSNIPPNIITSTGGAVTIRFNSNNLNNDTGFELIWQCSSNSCNAPTNINTTNIASSSAQLNWTDVTNVQDYNIQYRLLGANNGTWQNALADTNFIILDELIGNTTYEWRVQSNCTQNVLSVSSSLDTFTTILPFTVNPISLSDTLIIGDTSIYQLYLANQISNNLQYEIDFVPTIFEEDFEDSIHSFLHFNYGTTTAIVSNNNPASGIYCIEINGGSNYEAEGIYYDFNNDTPESLRFDVRSSASGQAAYVSLGQGNGTIDAIEFKVDAGNMGIFNTPNGIFYSRAINSNQWYHIDLLNINFTTHTFDFYIDGELIKANMGFLMNWSSVSRLRMKNFTNTFSAFDNIKISGSSIASNNDWLTTLPNAGTVLVNEVDTINAKFDATIISTGVHKGTLKIVSKQPDSSFVAIATKLLVRDVSIADFFASTTSTCDGNVAFTNTTQNESMAWHWDFGDGNTDTVEHPVHIYQTSGIYSASLIACNDLGCDTLVKPQYINVNLSGQYCDTVFTMNNTNRTVTDCSGIIYDDGGVNGNYSNNTISIVTIEPFNATNVTLTFNSFQLQNCCAVLTIYDGNSINAPVLASYSSSTIPAPITSTGGAITIKSSSIYSINTQSGFEITWQCSNVSCVTPTNLSSANVTPYEEVLNWNASSNATNYKLKWRALGATSWSYIDNVGGTSYNLTNLIANTDYEWTIQSVCNNSLSNLSTTDTFTTQAIIPITYVVNTAINVSCYGDTDGVINISVSGGFPPFTYLWNNGNTTQDLSNLSGGVYTCTITDVINSVLAINSILIDEPEDSLAFTQSFTPISCYGFSDGSIDLTVTGGTGNHSYIWSNNNTTEDLTNLAVGTYACTISDDNNCAVTTGTIIITSPDSIGIIDTIITNDNGLGNSAIDITVTGGLAPYQYSWSNGATTEDITGLPPTTYTVIITDAMNCQATFIFDILVGTNRINEWKNVHIYPVPIAAGKQLTVDLPISLSNVTYQIDNILGQKIDSGILSQQGGNAKLLIPSQSGVYIISFFEAGVKLKSFKVIVE
jgi:PKD repeat protein/subtilisin family serine protease